MSIGRTPARTTPQRSAFTLIELLVVVAIISILAQIAVPNFLEAQTRARVARTKNDMRALRDALEIYYIDNNDYPVRHNTQLVGITSPPRVPEVCTRLPQMSVLTTPIAYCTSLPVDLFETRLPPPNNLIDYYDSIQVAWLINAVHLKSSPRRVDPGEVGYMLISVGPDGYVGGSTGFDEAGIDDYGWPYHYLTNFTVGTPYDPTNGTVSIGNIFAGSEGGIDQADIKLMDRLQRVRVF